MKWSLMVLSLALTALFSFQVAACDGCGCQKGDDDDGDGEVRMSVAEYSAPEVYCGKDKDDGDSVEIGFCGKDKDDGDGES